MAGIRLAIVLFNGPWFGVDGGAYLINVNTVLGLVDPDIAPWPRPALAPGWLLVPFVHDFSPDVGMKVWTALVSLIPVWGTWHVARGFLSRNHALLAACFTSCDIYLLQQFVGGPLPAIAYGLLAVAIRASMDLARSPEWRPGLILTWGLALAPIGLINQTSVVYVPLVAVPALLGAVWYRRRLHWHVPVAIACVGLVIGLSVLSYLSLLPGSEHVSYSGWDLTFRPDLWAIVLGGFGLAWGVWHIRQGTALYPYAVALVILSALRFWIAGDEALGNIFFRAWSLQAMMVMPAIVQTVSVWIPWPQMRRGVAAIALLGMAGIAGMYLNIQVSEADRVGPEETAAFEAWAGAPHAGTILTHNFSLSRWAEGIHNRPALTLWQREPPPAYRTDDDLARCVIGWIACADPESTAASLGVTHVLIDLAWDGDLYGQPEDGWARTLDAPWLKKVYAEEGIRLYEVRAH